MSGTLHIESVGSGPPLVLLHGWAMHSGIWGPLVPRLAKRFRVHAVDLPGHGRSSLVAPFTLEGAVGAVSAALADEGHPLAVLGWSLGGLIAMRWARNDPAKVGRLALVATSPRFAAGDDWPHAVPPDVLARFGDELHVAWKITIQRFLALQMRGSEHGRATLAALRQQVFGHGEPSPKALSGAFDVIVGSDLRAEVAEIAQPAIVIAGSRDTLAIPAAGRWLCEHLADARFALISGAAHVPFLSHAEPFGEALDGFLNGH